jgi:pimeloyl-ACP methyl ester carboxylesterase
LKKLLVIIPIVVVVLSACRKRLDNFLFNPDTSINEYLMDDYTGPGELTLGASYVIPDSLVHKFTFESTDEGKTETIHAIYIGDLSKISTDTVILYCHGNAGHMDYYWARQKLIAHAGGKNHFGVLQLDYPGYGLSTGAPTESNMYASVGHAIDWLKSKGLSNDKFYMYGFSLGSAPVCKITAAKTYALTPSKIVIESPFASAEVMVQDAAGLNMPGSYFVNLKIDNAEQIKNIDQPLLWIHGTDDDFLSIVTHGEVFYKNYKGAYGEALRVEGGNHPDVPAVFGYANYLLTLTKFLQK